MWRRRPADSNRRLLLSGWKEEDTEPCCDRLVCRSLISPRLSDNGVRCVPQACSGRNKPPQDVWHHMLIFLYFTGHGKPLKVLRQCWLTGEYLDIITFSYIFMKVFVNCCHEDKPKTNIYFSLFPTSPPYYCHWLCLIHAKAMLVPFRLHHTLSNFHHLKITTESAICNSDWLKQG